MTAAVALPAADTDAPASIAHARHVPVLDGIRAISIVAVLITHLAPVRVYGQKLNGSVGMFGMALFFVLSGYLITQQLLKRPTLGEFAVRRLMRIVPAAWLCIAVVWLFRPMDLDVALSHFLFYANLPPQTLAPPLGHYWSLCVELQFYALVALLLYVSPRISAWVLPLLLLGVTALRVAHGVTASSITWYRIDDILAGATLALALHWYARRRGTVPADASPRMPSHSRPPLRTDVLVCALLALFCAACVLPPTGSPALTYLRPYFAAAFVGALLLAPQSLLARALARPSFSYIAAISYALYLWHQPLADTWLGSGDVVEKYLKRPLLLAVLLLVAHVSTFHFERRCTEWGRRIARSLSSRSTPSQQEH